MPTLSPTAARSVPAAVALFLTLAATSWAPAQAPLHERIDQLVAAGKSDFAKRAAPLAPDAEFFRRVTLDLTGTIPSSVETRKFLDDPSPAKRQQLIDRLLASPEHARRMENVFDVMLMERRRDQHVPRAQWQEYLRISFAANKPWDQLAREILSAEGADPKQRPAAKFLLDRDGELHLMTRDVGRLFLGLNLQCAQCHDHPLVEHYKQADYYGIAAFFNRTSLFTDPKTRQSALAEKAEGEVSFQSVFDPAKATRTTGPRVPGGQLVKESATEKGKEYTVKPANGVRPVPAYSRRAQLAGQVASRDNLAFRRNIANRLWALLMGHGLVHPLDMDHPANPPSHPELLAMLADDIGARSFDMRGFLRELALSQTYQRSSEVPPGVEAVEPREFAVANLKPLSPEQLAWALMQATGLTDAERLALGNNVTEAALYSRLSGSVTPFVAAFGGRPGEADGQTFQATLDQSLFLRNGALIRGWLTPRAGNLTDRLMKMTDPSAVAEELYLSVLTRRPLDEERREVAEMLRARPDDRLGAMQDLAWALLASAEFRFNH